MITASPERTRDGMPSIVGRMADYGEVEVDLETVTAWARDNMRGIADGKVSMADIHAARSREGLPRFKVMRRPSGDAMVPRREERQPSPVELAPLPKSHDSITPHWPTSEFELIDLVTGHDGTLTGLVSPDMAGWLLNLNTGNRPLSKGGVARYVAILQGGTWLQTGEPIIVSKVGVLNDGQHRLHAIVKSGISARLDIRFGIERDAFVATGSGQRRTLGNVLAIAGKRCASAQAAIARLLYHHDAGRMDLSTQQVEGADVLAVAEANPAIEAVATHIAKSKFAPARSSPFGMSLVLACRAGQPLERVFAFADLVASGIAEETNPARLLHVRLRDVAMAKQRLSQIEIAALAVLAFNAWCAGKPLRHLRIDDAHRTGAGFPKVVGNG